MKATVYYGGLAAITAAGLLLRLWCLTCGSFDLDEGYTMLMARAPITEILSRAPYEANPPLGPILYRLWSMLVQDREYAVELLSVIFGVLSIVMCGQLGRRLFDERVGLAAALLLSVSVFHLRYSQYVRSYSAAVFFGLASAYAFFVMLQGGGRRWFLIFVAAALVFMNLHYVALLPVAAFVGYGLCCAPAQRRLVLKAALLLGVLFAPTLYALILQYCCFSSVEGIPTPSLAYAAALHYELHSGSPVLAPLMLSLAVVGLFFWRQRRERPYRFVLAAWVAPLGLALALSLLGKSFFLPRYFVLTLPAYLVLVAYGIARLPGRFAGMIVCAVIAAASMAPLRDYYRERRSSGALKRACRYAARHFQRGDAIIHTLKYSYAPCLYYHRYSLEEYYLRTKKTLNLFRVWYEHPAEIELDGAARYQRVWFVAPNQLAASAIDGLLQYGGFADRGPVLRYVSPDNNLAMIEFTLPGAKLSQSQ